MKSAGSYLFLFFVSVVMAACTNNKVIDDKVNLAPAEMRAVLEQKAKIKAQRVEIESVSMQDTSVKIVFYNSVIGGKNANIAATELVTDILQYTGFQSQFASYQIKYEFKAEWFLGFVKYKTYKEILIDKKQMDEMKSALNKPELVLPPAIYKNYKNKNYETVIALSDSLLKMDVSGGHRADIHLLRASSFLKIEDTLGVIKECESLTQLADTLPKNWPLLATLYQKINETKKEKRCWLKSLEYDSANGKIYYNLALIAHKANEHDESCKLYRKAIELKYDFSKGDLTLCE